MLAGHKRHFTSESIAPLQASALKSPAQARLWREGFGSHGWRGAGRGIGFVTTGTGSGVTFTGAS